MIIALGELVLVAGLSYAGTDLSLPQTVAFLLVFATAVLIGLLYVTPAGQRLGPAIERADPAWLGVITGYLHLVMIAGLVVTAVGAELSIAHPMETGDTTAVLVILSGPTLFLVGRILFSAAIHRRLSFRRVAALVVLAAARRPCCGCRWWWSARSPPGWRSRWSSWTTLEIGPAPPSWRVVEKPD